MQLPQDLQEALAGVLSQGSVKALRAAAEDLSRRYRAPASGKGPLLRAREDILAYLAVRLPATFAASHAALAQVKAQLPHFTPRTLLDAGAGPGTALWAAAALFPSLEAATLLERDREMIAAGRRLAAGASAPVLRAAAWDEAHLDQAFSAPPHDLTVAAYVLGELGQGAQDALADRLWRATEGVMLLVEPGTPQGFARILRQRDRVLAQGARTIAPCPHDDACPIAGSDWCHFAERISRSALHRRVKGADLGYEDEKFSFVALSRLAPLPLAGRVIRHPQVRGGHVHVALCTPRGLESTVATRKDKDRYRLAKDLRWGDPTPWDAAEGAPVRPRDGGGKEQP